MKRNHFRSFAILIGLLACAGACYGILHLWQQPADAYWTATAFSPPSPPPPTASNSSSPTSRS